MVSIKEIERTIGAIGDITESQIACARLALAKTCARNCDTISARAIYDELANMVGLKETDA